MQVTLTLNVTKQEILAKFGFPDDTILVIDGEQSVADIGQATSEANKTESDNGWVSNIGHRYDRYPDKLCDYDQIVVKHRNGSTSVGYACDWGWAWCETDNSDEDIVAYCKL